MIIQVLKGFENRFRWAIAEGSRALPLEAVSKLALKTETLTLDSDQNADVFDLTTYPKVIQVTLKDELPAGVHNAWLIVYSDDHPDGRPWPSNLDDTIEIEVIE